MLKRIKHALFGHQYKYWSGSGINGTGQMKYFGLNREADYHEVYGFTEIIYQCECGSIKRFRAVGKHGRTIDDDEVDKLRKMVGL